ncbi:MAG TPA: hypothetical protein VF002_08745 [Gaiellaceae bacterium]
MAGPEPRAEQEIAPESALLRAAPEIEPKLEEETKSLPNFAPEAQPEGVLDVEGGQPALELEAQPEPKLEAQSEPKLETQPEPKLEAQPEPKLEPQPEGELESQPEPALEPQPEPKLEAQPEPEPEPESEAQPDPELVEAAKQRAEGIEERPVPGPVAEERDDRDALIASLRRRLDAQEAELIALREALEAERAKEEIQVHVWPEEHTVAVSQPTQSQKERYLLCVPTPAGYVLLDRVGPVPSVGQEVDVPEEDGQFTVTKVVRLPRNGRHCAYLQRS